MSADLRVGTARADEREAVVALIAACQARPDRHVCYLSLDPAAIDTEVAALAPHGWSGVVVARRDGRVVGALAIEHDHRPPRAWWYGPFVAGAEPFAEIGDALLAAGRARLPEHVTEQELGPDTRHRDLVGLAERHGFAPDPASAVLTRSTTTPVEVAVPDGVVIRRFNDRDRAAVAAIHDGAFPQAHVPGDEVDAGAGRLVFVAEVAGEVVGYAAAERQDDGSGYLDFLGVVPTVRGRGTGAALVGAAVEALVARYDCEKVNLTVRETNDAARRLYHRLGFTEERLIRPYRLGFSAS